MSDPVTSKEFFGRFSISFKDGETIYAYDEITHGLYKFTLPLGKVKLIIPYESIHQNSNNRIIGISKRGTEIILIPLILDTEWIFYDERENKIRFELVVKNKVCMSSAITIGSNLLLIPSYVCDPIIIVSLDCMEDIKVYKGWYKKRENKKFCIWGASCYKDVVVFPIVNTKEIVCLKRDKICTLILNIPETILSDSIYGDKIWILPTSGTYIYSINYCGKIVDKVDISEADSKIALDEFNRVVAVENMIFLFPIHSEIVWVYQCEKQQFQQITTKSLLLSGSLFVWLAASYWDYIVDGQTIYLLPGEYRCKKIYMPSLKCKEYKFYYGSNMSEETYWKMIQNVQQNIFVEKRKSDLAEFIQYAFFIKTQYLGEEIKTMGDKIWGNIME